MLPEQPNTPHARPVGGAGRVLWVLLTLVGGNHHKKLRTAHQGKGKCGILGGHRILCASLAQAGQIEEAKAVLRTLQKLHPEVSVAWIERSVPYTAAPMEKFLDGLIKAGLTN